MVTRKMDPDSYPAFGKAVDTRAAFQQLHLFFIAEEDLSFIIHEIRVCPVSVPNSKLLERPQFAMVINDEFSH